MDINIIEFEKFDIKKIINLCFESVEYCCKDDYSLAQINYWKNTLIPELFYKIKHNTENFQGFIATDNSDIIGVCFLDLIENKILALYVNPKFSRRNIGKSLMVKVENAAKIKGLKELQLDASFNAIAFYKHLGYKEIPTNISTIPEVPSVKMKKTI